MSLYEGDISMLQGFPCGKESEEYPAEKHKGASHFD